MISLGLCITPSHYLRLQSQFLSVYATEIPTRFFTSTTATPTTAHSPREIFRSSVLFSSSADETMPTEEHVGREEGCSRPMLHFQYSRRSDPRFTKLIRWLNTDSGSNGKLEGRRRTIRFPRVPPVFPANWPRIHRQTKTCEALRPNVCWNPCKYFPVVLNNFRTADLIAPFNYRPPLINCLVAPMEGAAASRRTPA